MVLSIFLYAYFWTCISSLMKYLFNIYPNFLLNFCFLIIEFKSSFKFWIYDLYQINVLSMYCLFIPLAVSTKELKFILLIKCTLSIFFFYRHVFGLISKKYLPNSGKQSFLLCFLLEVLYF